MSHYNSFSFNYVNAELSSSMNQKYNDLYIFTELWHLNNHEAKMPMLVVSSVDRRKCRDLTERIWSKHNSTTRRLSNMSLEGVEVISQLRYHCRSND